MLKYCQPIDILERILRRNALWNGNAAISIEEYGKWCFLYVEPDDGRIFSYKIRGSSELIQNAVDEMRANFSRLWKELYNESPNYL